MSMRLDTMDLEKICKYIVMSSYNGHYKKQKVEVKIAEEYCEWKDNPVIVEYVENLFRESDISIIIDNMELMTTPVSERKWERVHTSPTNYDPNTYPLDCTSLYDEFEHYIYVESEVRGKWGDTYWISDNGLNYLESLPTIKAFQNFDFEVGKFYKVQCTDVIYWGNNKKKYVFDIEESNEEEFLNKGIFARAKFERVYDGRAHHI